MSKRAGLIAAVAIGAVLVVTGLAEQLVVLTVLGVLMASVSAIYFAAARAGVQRVRPAETTGFDARIESRFGPPSLTEAAHAEVFTSEPVSDAVRQMAMFAAVIALLLAVIGALMQFATVSLLTGDSIYWIGAALAIIGAVIAFAMSGRGWVVAVSVILAVLCVFNVVYTEHQFSDRRHQISNLLNN